MSVLPRLVGDVEDRWPAAGQAPEDHDPLGQLVLASHLLGADRAVANYGGGNTSAKGVATDHLGRELAVMWVKGSGSDLATMRPREFTRLRLDDVRALFARAHMTDDEMVAYLARCQLDPDAPRSSIETLLHAFIPAAHVHHTHPDAINVLAGTRDGERLVAECFGEAATWIPYMRPGFGLAKRLGEEVRRDPALLLVVLAKHGLVTWGDSAEQAYRRTIEVINRAAEFVNARANGTQRFGGPLAGSEDVGRQGVLRAVLPVIRGAVSSEAAKVLVVDTSPAVEEFVGSRDAEELVTIGAACPDHLVHTKRIPLWIPYDPESDDAESLAARIRELSVRFRADYEAYFARHAEGDTARDDPDARVVLVQRLGLVGAGTSTKAARLSRDLYRRAVEVQAGAHALGGFTSLTEAESFAIEYWPLERYKLSLAPPPGELQGHVALVTGAAGGIGRAVVERLAGAGACVVGFDLDGEGAADAVRPLGEGGVAVGGDVTIEADVRAGFAAAVESYGGLDIVVSCAGVAASAPLEDTTLDDWNRIHSILVTGYFLVAREGLSILRAQDRGGSIVFVGSKNALAAGRHVAAYSAAKAAELHLARCLAEEAGPYGVRVNTVNPDAVLEGSRIWDSSWREERAAAYGIATDDLGEYYRARTTLGVKVVPEDVAEAVLHFASSARSGKSTGNILNVDGGVAAAYPR
jgi:rhamnulose-1-phosphate aldolase/alcohol dehydrogenase